MLRRKPTVISLTTEDVATYDEARAREAAAIEAARLEQMQTENQRRGGSRDLTPVSREKASGPGAPVRRTRDERLGIGRAQ